MTTQTISAITTPSRRAVAFGSAVFLVLGALLVGVVVGAGVAGWWQSRTAAGTAGTVSAAAVAVSRPALDPAALRYGVRDAQLEAALAVTGASAGVAARPAQGPAALRYGVRDAQLEAALAVTGAPPVVVARPAVDPAVQRYGARAAQLEAVAAGTGTSAARRAPVDPESRYYGRTRLVRPSSPDVAPKVAVAQVRTPETHVYGARSGS